MLNVVLQGHAAMWAPMRERDAIYADTEAGEEEFLKAAGLDNQLDIESTESLNTALDKYMGAFIFVSHDREPASSLDTRIIELLALRRGGRCPWCHRRLLGGRAMKDRRHSAVHLTQVRAEAEPRACGGRVQEELPLA